MHMPDKFDRRRVPAAGVVGGAPLARARCHQAGFLGALGRKFSAGSAGKELRGG